MLSPHSSPTAAFRPGEDLRPQPFFSRAESGFTLIELLLVVAIIVAMMSLLVPAFTSINGANGLTATAYDIAGTLERARAYAMANNTFVWVGIEEVDASQSASAKPQNSGTGAVAIAVVASKDGTRGYDASSVNLTSPAWTASTSGTNLTAISKVQRFTGVHLAAYNNLPTTGGLTRPAIATTAVAADVLGEQTCTSVTPFNWPLGSTGTSVQYAFSKVINFDPQGVARIQTGNSSDTIEPYLEIGLQPAHGTAVSTVTTNCAVIQVDGITGAAKTYRP